MKVTENWINTLFPSNMCSSGPPPKTPQISTETSKMRSLRRQSYTMIHFFWHLLVNHLTDSPRWRVVRCTGQVGAGWLQVEPGSCSQFLALERSHFLFFGKCLVRRQFLRQLRNSVEIWPLGNVIMHSSSNSSSLPF